MKPLILYLTPIDATRFKVIITDTHQGGEDETESSLLCGGYDWRNTVLKALEASNFRPKDFQRLGEQEWMVEFGLLAEDRTAFRPDMLKNIGRLLYRTLFPDSPEGRKVEQLLQDAIRFAEMGRTQLHIRISFKENAGQRARLPDYPWELLHDDRGFLAQRQVGFSRYIAYRASSPDLPSVDKVNVLLVSSTAFDRETGLERLPSQEKQAVQRSLDKAQQEGRIRLIELRPATCDALRAYLTENRGDDAPHVIHFDGHGFFGKRCDNLLPNNEQCRTMHSGITADKCKSCGASLGQPQGFLLFENNVGGANYISAEELGILLRQASLSDNARQQSGVALVVLSACQSGLSMGGNSVFNGIAQSLIDHRVPAVVAIQFSVKVDKATAFSEQFYRCLGRKDPLVRAVSWGREAMGPESNQWYRPVLYLRWQDNEGGQLFAQSQIDADRIFPSLAPPPTSVVIPSANLQQTSFQNQPPQPMDQPALNIPTRLRALSAKEKEQLVDKLLAVKTMKNRNSRNQVVQELSFADSIDRDSNTSNKDDVMNIVNRCLDFSDGLQQLIERIEYREENSQPMQQLRALVNSLS